MIEYDIQHSDGVPEECWDWNEKPECRQYDYLKENNLDWDEYGNYKPILYPGKHPSTGGTPESPPTIKEAFPECYNEEGMFLSECGNINIILDKNGSVTYIIDKQIDDIINNFENKSVQHGYAPGTSANGTDRQISDGEWTIDEGNWTISNKAREIKKDMNQITKQIKNITYAPGTGPGDNGGVVIDGDDNRRYAPGTGPGDNGGVNIDNVVAGDGNGGDAKDTIDAGDIVIDNSKTVDSRTIDNSGSDSGGNDVDNTIDPGPDGIVGVIDED